MPVARVFPRKGFASVCSTESWSCGCIYILFLSFFLHLHCHFFFLSASLSNKHLFLFIFYLSFLPSISRYLYADPLHCNMTYLLLRLLKDDLKEYTYAARLAGLVYGVASGMNAILVSKPFEVWREVWAPVKGPLWCSNRVKMAWVFLRYVWLREVLSCLHNKYLVEINMKLTS